MTDELYSPIDITTLPPMHVACYRTVSAAPEDEGGKIILAWAARQGIQYPAEARLFGFDAPIEGDVWEKDGLRCYVFWITVPPEVQPSEGVTLKDYPGGLYARMTIFQAFRDPIKIIPEGQMRLYNWAKDGPDYQVGPHQWLEEVPNGEAGEDLVLYCPIAPR
jgi:DNA gyrase inhibitor GyrI